MEAILNPVVCNVYQRSSMSSVLTEISNVPDLVASCQLPNKAMLIELVHLSPEQIPQPSQLNAIRSSQHTAL